MARERFARHATALDLAHDVERWIAGQHEQGRVYDALRLEGNELRSSLGACIRDVGTIARFVATLPPIQGLIDVENSDDKDGMATWRERLSTICHGLLRTKPVLNGITYSRATDDTVRELVRVERHRADASSIRTIPRSRLAEGERDSFSSAVISQKPEEAFIDLVGIVNESTATAAREPQRLVAGVPIFDHRSEEVVGLVTVEVDFDRLLEAEIRTHARSADEIFIVNNQGMVVRHQGSGQVQQAVGKPAEEFFPEWAAIASEASARGEFVDEDRAVYAITLELMPAVSSLPIALLVRTAN